MSQTNLSQRDSNWPARRHQKWSCETCSCWTGDSGYACSQTTGDLGKASCVFQPFLKSIKASCVFQLFLKSMNTSTNQLHQPISKPVTQGNLHMSASFQVSNSSQSVSQPVSWDDLHVTGSYQVGNTAVSQSRHVMCKPVICNVNWSINQAVI